MNKFTNTITILIMLSFSSVLYAETMDIWFSPGWKTKPQAAKSISSALEKDSGVKIKPRIAKSYPQMLDAMASSKPSLVYVGSFVQAIIHARGTGTGLVQAANGKELYSGVLIYKKGGDPESILKNHPSNVAFAVGASSGESTAKAATSGQAAFKTRNHKATAGAVKAGKAKAGVVKNWWWKANGSKYPDLAMYEIPNISVTKNPDNVLSASNSVSSATRVKIKQAAVKNKDVFKAKNMVDFDKSKLDFTLSLMKKGKIDPMTYSW